MRSAGLWNSIQDPSRNSLAPDVQDAFGDQVNITRFTLTGDQVMQVGAKMASTGFPAPGRSIGLGGETFLRCWVVPQLGVSSSRTGFAI
jgi:hypothetical protein